MQEKKHNEIKKEIRSVLLTYQESVTLEEFLRTYKDLIGQKLPSKELGFKTDLAFLTSIPDVVNLSSSPSGRVLLNGIADEKSQHIQKLVSKQRPKPKNNKQNRRQPTRKLPSNVVCREIEPFVPGPMRAEILQLMAAHPRGLNFTAFVVTYSKKFNKYLPLPRGFDSLDGFIKLIPQLEIKVEGNEKIIICKNVQSNINQEAFGMEKSVNTSPEKDKIPHHSLNIHKSGISDDVLQNFQLLMQKCSGGILDVHFPLLYENLTGKPFELHELGYNSILNLVDALPHIFKRILDPSNNNHWIILPQDSPLKHSIKDGGASPSSHRGIPADASPPNFQYIQPFIPKNIDLTKYILVFVSAIIDPSLFWFQLQTEEEIKNFEAFEEDMRGFYKSYSDKYRMKHGDIAIGATCVFLNPGDKLFYRGIIKSIPSVNLVNVSYVDYGDVENVPRTNLFYVRSKYHDYPAHAFKARLASVKPPNNASTWNFESQKRFTDLCNCFLMANVISIDKDTFMVNLCDTNGDTDVYVGDILINEGLAELCSESDVDIRSNKSGDSPSGLALVNGMKIGSASKSSFIGNQSDTSTSISESEVLSVKRKLHFSPEKLHSNGINSNISSARKEQYTKRFVKLLQLCEDIEMYFINLENKLYMSFSDISKLIWKDKDSDFLIERLKYKDVDVPHLVLSKENHAELFRQCIWCEIPEFETLKSDNSSLIVCPIEWALKILNIFGHPSICIRLAIQDEIRSFDPLDPIWKEFCYEETDDLEKEIEKSLQNLCLYDLRTKSEALKIRRLKLLRLDNSSSNEKIKMVEIHQKIIGRRIKEIEAICLRYSS